MIRNDTEDPNRIQVTDPELKDTVLYARHVGATADDAVVAYLKQCDCDGWTRKNTT